MSVGRHLVAGAQLDQVVRGPRRPSAISVIRAVPDHPGGGRVEQRQPVELPLGQVLLDDPDRRVDHQDHAEQAVGERPGGEDQHEQRAEDRVEPGEDVGLDDHPQRPGGRLIGGVDLAARRPARRPRPRSARCPGRSPERQRWRSARSAAHRSRAHCSRHRAYRVCVQASEPTVRRPPDRGARLLPSPPPPREGSNEASLDGLLGDGCRHDLVATVQPHLDPTP